ncbi:plasmid replication protein [Ligilactobacillus agilis]|uniref:Plasmid replication protein n=1 Tax=Ligilactobacillus agilis TaxID=1601 RepID=A0A6F9XQB0_9LACO|nr:plasmid replication protein [Ligilactobacillus agilis]GET11252.1 plasmid replication protein [Ligilactobacillus agilis]
MVSNAYKCKKLWVIDDYKMVLKDGLREFKFKNSRLKPAGHTERTKGSVALFRTKADLAFGRGFIATSLEAIGDNADHAPSHWTANPFRYLTYKEGTQSVIGHTEDNLRQINQIFIDIDTKENDINVLVLDFNELGIIPTYIIETPRGYQVFWILETPGYVNSTHKVVSVLKSVRANLVKFAQEQGYQVDSGANCFGVSRFPTEDNVIFNIRTEYKIADLISVSKELSQKFDQNTMVLHSMKVKAPQNTSNKRQIDSEWYQLLFTQGASILGRKGCYGRDNAIFTMALANYSSGSPYEVALGKMLEWNCRLDNPLTDQVVEQKVKSAYSGNYQAAAEEYAQNLIETYISNEAGSLFSRTPAYWHKFKKARAERKYSHLKEWRDDLIAYIKQKTTAASPYIKLSTSELVDALGIPERSLARLRSALVEDTTLMIIARPGVATTFALINYVAVYLLTEMRTKKLALKQLLTEFIKRNPISSTVSAFLKNTINLFQNGIAPNKANQIEQDTLKLII